MKLDCCLRASLEFAGNEVVAEFFAGLGSEVQWLHLEASFIP